MHSTILILSSHYEVKPALTSTRAPEMTEKLKRVVNIGTQKCLITSLTILHNKISHIFNMRKLSHEQITSITTLLGEGKKKKPKLE